MNVHDILESAPADIARKETLVAQERQAFDLAKHQLSIARARATIRHQDQKNQTIIQAHVEMDEEVIAAEVKVIEQTGRLKIAEVAYHESDNAFASARKMASAGDTSSTIATFSPSHDTD